MHSRKIVLTAFLSSLITILLVVVVFAGVGSTLANNASQEGNPDPNSPNISDQTDVVQSPEVPEAPDLVAGTTYVHYSGSVFTPFISTTTYSHSWYGCMTASGDLNYSVDLPNGSVITFMRLYYNDTNVTLGGRLRLYWFDDGPDGDFSEQLSTAGSSGYGSTYISGISITLNNILYSYVLSWEPSTNVQLCGVLIGYTSPYFSFGSALPIIKK